MITSSEVEHLDAEGCQRLLRTDNLGRLALIVRGRADIFPVNYLVSDG